MAKKTSGKPQDQQISASPSAGNAAQMSNGNGSERKGDGAGGRDGLSSDEIAARAYEIYVREGRSDGRDMDHWLQAESELRTERQQRQASASNPQSRQELPRSARQHQPSTGV